jgi:hypothetical protein
MTVTAAALDDGPKEPSTNLYVAGLPWGYHENRLRKLFQKYGPVFSVVIFKSRGSACVQLQSLTDAIAAKEALHGSKIKAHKEQHVIAVRYADKTYKPQPKTPAVPMDPPAACHPAPRFPSPPSETESVGPSSETLSETNEEESLGDLSSDSLLSFVSDMSECGISLGDELDMLEPQESADSIHSGPPTPQAIAQANNLLEQWVPTWELPQAGPSPLARDAFVPFVKILR